MKKKMILFTVIALFLLIGGMGCEREIDVYKDIPITYHKKCDKFNEYFKITNKEFIDIPLFDLSKTSEEEIQKTHREYIIYNYNPQDSTEWWVLYKEYSKSVTEYKYPITTGSFCNFPEEIRNWNISPKGLNVRFNVDVYQGIGVLVADGRTQLDFVLTSLKIQQP